MKNLKKIGLSALAGSLVAFSANAAELSVSGGVEVTYTDTGGNQGNEVTGNSYGANSTVGLTGSGDVGFGTVSMTRTINDTNSGWESSYQTLDMGDMGVFSFDSTGGALVGITASDDILPTAYEEMWTGVSGSGINGVGSTNVIGYQNSFGMFSVSAGYSQNGTSTAESGSSGQASHGSSTDISVKAEIMDGLTIQAGYAEDGAASTSTTSEDTTSIVGHVLYSTGPVSVGFRAAETNYGTAATASRSIEAMSIAFNVNENLSLSYQTYEIDHLATSGGTDYNTEFDAIGAAYTMGAAKVTLNSSEQSGNDSSTTYNEERTEIALSLNF